MHRMRVWRSMASVDLRNVRRDALLPWMAAVPLVIALLLRLGVPALSRWLRAEFGFALEPYFPLLMSFLVMTAPGMAGMVTGFLLLDERDEQVHAALRVTPVAFGTYLSYRIATPLFLGLVATLVAYPVADLAPVPFPDLLAVALLSAFAGPITALFLAAFAENKVSGLALVKVVNTVNMLPVLAYFLAEPWQFVAGVVPAFWPMKALWLAAAGRGLVWCTAGGFGVNLAVLLLLLRRVHAKLQP